MKTLKLTLAAVAAFAFNASAAPTGPIGMGNPPTGLYQAPVVTGSAPDSQGFHAGGVAACDGCHVMHNASNGVAKSTTGKGSSVAPWTNVTNMYLLQGSDQSSTCLICHSGKYTAGAQFIVADLSNPAPNSWPSNYTPGGDFGWTLYGFANSASERHGHNVAAGDFGMVVDKDYTRGAPGGSWIGGEGKSAFACSSCHDPHGRYRVENQNGTYKFTGGSSNTPATKPIAASGSYGQEPTVDYAVGAYRLLAGQGYAPASTTSAPFPNDPPVAVAPQSYNKVETPTTETRVAYGSGMSEWCQNCHTNIHLDGYTSGVAGLRHPAGSTSYLRGNQIDIYNKYVSSGVLQVSATGRYTSLVPFEQTGLTIAQLKANTASNGSIIASSTSAVMCLSCHRAHASAFDSMVRWDQNATFLTSANAYTAGLTDRTTDQTKAGYYGRAASDLGNYQRSLCNKCHGKD